MPRRRVHRFEFDPQVPMCEVRDTLSLAILATRSVFGRRLFTLRADYALSECYRNCWIDVSTDVGRHLHQVFHGFVASEFGPHSFKVSRCSDAADPELDALLMSA
jgi:hypothetical protein